jgi:hypothetical protein
VGGWGRVGNMILMFPRLRQLLASHMERCNSSRAGQHLAAPTHQYLLPGTASQAARLARLWARWLCCAAVLESSALPIACCFP